MSGARFNYEPLDDGSVVKSSPHGFRKVMTIGEAEGQLAEMRRVPGIHSDIADLQAAIQLAKEATA